MELTFFLLLAAVAAALSLQRRLLRPRPIALFSDPNPLRTIADRFGLAETDGRAEGYIDELSIQIEELGADQFFFFIDSRGRIPSWLRIDEHHIPRSRRNGIGFETRDLFFDNRFLVFAPPVGGAALLDAGVRRAFLELGRVRLEGGVLSASITASRTGAIERSFRQLLDAARLLAANTPYEERLFHIATTDQNPFVRMQALELLARKRGHSDAAQRALWLALDDPHVPAALFAAIHLGARVAGDHLKRLARLAASAEDTRIAAFRELLAHESPEQMLPLLLEASRSLYGNFAERALRWAVQHGGRTALLELLRAPGATQSQNLIAFLEETAKLLRREAGEKEATFDPELEQAVLRILLDTRRRLADAREAAARFLGVFGSPNAVAALKEIAKGELDAPPHVARAARDALARIQARKSALSGGLALVGSDGGDLSFADTERGGISPLPAEADAEPSQ